MNDILAEIFKKIGSKENTKEVIGLFLQGRRYDALEWCIQQL